MVEDSEINRLYRVLEYASHRLAEMNGVVGRLQSVAGGFFTAALAGLPVLAGAAVYVPQIVLPASPSLAWIIIFSSLMLTVSLTGESATHGLGKTPWFFREMIGFKPDCASDYKSEHFQQDVSNYKGLIGSPDEVWMNYCISQILQLFVNQSIRLHQVSRMKLFLKVGLVGLLITNVFLVALVLMSFITQFPPL